MEPKPDKHLNYLTGVLVELLEQRSNLLNDVMGVEEMIRCIRIEMKKYPRKNHSEDVPNELSTLSFKRKRPRPPVESDRLAG